MPSLKNVKPVSDIASNNNNNQVPDTDPFMPDIAGSLSEFFMNSPLREFSDNLLRSVPGLPPVVQTIHLLGVAVIVGSMVFLCLRILGLAANRQDPYEMAQRLFPWFFSAIPVMFISGAVFFLARPQRYIYNPIFTIKTVAFLLTIIASFCLWKYSSELKTNTIRLPTKLLAAVVMTGWVITALAGRWIAYSDYIFWPE